MRELPLSGSLCANVRVRKDGMDELEAAGLLETSTGLSQPDAESHRPFVRVEYTVP